MTQSATPGWYADPQGLSAYRWWDGLAWTTHVNDGQPAEPAQPAKPAQPVAQQASYGMPGTAVVTRPVQQAQRSQFRQTSQVSGWERNRYAFITLAIVAVYVVIAWKSHFVVIGLLPIAMSARSKTRGEPLAIVAIIAAVIAVLVAVLALTHH